MGNSVVLLSNIIFEPYWYKCLKEAFISSNLDVQTTYVPYESFRDYSNTLTDADTVVICLSFDVLYPNISNEVHSKNVTYDDVLMDCIYKCDEVYSFIKTCTNAKIIWFGFEDYFDCHEIICGNVQHYNGIVDKINSKLFNIIEKDIYIDFKRLIAKIGIANAYDTKSKYRWNAPYSKELISHMANEVYKQHLITVGNTKKCLVLDCDNVLWGGTLSEDGIEGIQISNSGLGRHHQDFQRFLLEMYYHGVILTICSKNDEVDVLNVFRKHSGMLLREEHISCFRCNWDNKADNIKAIADILDIGLDSMVFVDDSQFEIELVKNVFPDVTTILYHGDTVYHALSCFNLRTNTDLQTIKERTSTYRTNVQREELKMNASSFDEYISSLNMKIDIHKTQEQELARLSELTQRTNKCTNGVRYTLEQLKARINKADYDLYTVCLSDRFSNLGIVGVMGISGQTIDLFSLSCRALGRNVENQMLFWLLEKHLYSVRYIKTGKNDTLKNLFKSHKIKLIES